MTNHLNGSMLCSNRLTVDVLVPVSLRVAPPYCLTPSFVVDLALSQPTTGIKQTRKAVIGSSRTLTSDFQTVTSLASSKRADVDPCVTCLACSSSCCTTGPGILC